MHVVEGSLSCPCSFFATLHKLCASKLRKRHIRTQAGASEHGNGARSYSEAYVKRAWIPGRGSAGVARDGRSSDGRVLPAGLDACSFRKPAPRGMLGRAMRGDGAGTGFRTRLWVAFRFRAIGGGSWWIDDFHAAARRTT